MEQEYYKSAESVDQYIKMAEGHHGGALIKKLEPHLSRNAKMLELGSGPGTDFQILNQQFTVTGSDFSNEFLSRLKLKYPDSDFLELDASTLSTNQKFDAIYSNKVLHHLNDEQLAASIKRQHEILNKDGVICHSFWKGEGSEIFKGLFVNYHTDEGLNTFFSELFEILRIEHYAEFERDDSTLLIARKK